MPRTGSQKSTMQGLALDATIACSRASEALLALVSDIDAAIRADLENDPYLTAAYASIREAAEEPNPEARAAQIGSAASNLRRAMELDFADRSIELVKEHILPHVVAIDGLKHRFLEIQSTLGKEGRGE